jgi:hypothetical protein
MRYLLDTLGKPDIHPATTSYIELPKLYVGQNHLCPYKFKLSF